VVERRRVRRRGTRGAAQDRAEALKICYLHVKNANLKIGETMAGGPASYQFLNSTECLPIISLTIFILRSAK
jgi:hypothetical protein